MLNIKNDNLIFFQTISFIKIRLLNNAIVFKSMIVDLKVFIFSKKNINFILTSFEFEEKFFFIYNIDAEFFDLLTKQSKI